MNPGNETCCFNHQGVKEITYHNTATILTVAGEWKTYYQDAGYSVPTTTARQSTSTLLASKDISNISASATSTVHSQGLDVSPSSPANQPGSTAVPKPVPASTSKTTTISAGEKAIIGIASALALFGAVGLLYLFQRSRAERRAQPELMKTRSAHSELDATGAPPELDASGAPPEMDTAGALSEIDAEGGWLSSKAHIPVAHEIMGQDHEGQIVEMSG